MDDTDVTISTGVVDYMKKAVNKTAKHFGGKEIFTIDDNPSSVSFVSGWNAALAHLKKVGLNEMTGTSAVAGYQTPYAFSKKKTGSQKALDATKKIGYKPTKKEY